jgi:hypothetical protein
MNLMKINTINKIVKVRNDETKSYTVKILEKAMTNKVSNGNSHRKVL